MTVFSYVVHHDRGREPNPFGGTCTLCRCKFDRIGEETRGRRTRKNIIELANKGDWIIGTGGNGPESSGHDTLIYVMRVDEKLTRADYAADARFHAKKLDPPRNDFEKHHQFALISRLFYYFGTDAVELPNRFREIQKRGPGFRYISEVEFKPFHEWLKRHKRGKLGGPCSPSTVGEVEVSLKCKSSC